MKRKYFIITLLVIYTSCTAVNNNIKKKPELNEIKDSRATQILKKVLEFNQNSPSSFKVSFEILGSIKNKKYKSIGSTKYQKSPLKMNIKFLDYIFKTPLTYIFQDKENFNFYFPVDKNLILDNINSINLVNYIDFDINFNIIYQLFTGKIPLIKNYSIKKGLSNNNHLKYLILENDKFYQTISFNRKKNKNIPDKILIINKNSKEKYELHIKKIKRIKQYYFFSNILFLSNNNDIKLKIKFKRIKLNIPVKIKPMKKFKFPGKINIIRM